QGRCAQGTDSGGGVPTIAPLTLTRRNPTELAAVKPCGTGREPGRSSFYRILMILMGRPHRSHSRSVVSAGSVVLSASERQARSPSDTPAARVAVHPDRLGAAASASTA